MGGTYGAVPTIGRDRLSERIDVAALLRVHREEPELAILLRLIKLVE